MSFQAVSLTYEICDVSIWWYNGLGGGRGANGSWDGSIDDATTVPIDPTKIWHVVWHGGEIERSGFGSRSGGIVDLLLRIDCALKGDPCFVDSDLIIDVRDDHIRGVICGSESEGEGKPIDTGVLPCTAGNNGGKIACGDVSVDDGAE